MPDSVAQWYFRSIHHERTREYLPGVLESWPAFSVDKLVHVCQSHGQPVKALSDLKTDRFLDIDLRFCAILLRLGDILDFDSTRVPTVIYDYTGIGGAPESVSYEEWRKHMASSGFHFPTEPQDAPYALPYRANCPDNRIEHSLRAFLDVIDQELRLCRELLGGCENRWKTLVLPLEVDRGGIESIGYEYGEYHLTLDQEQVLHLLAGENLYSDPTVFVRELIQNALDAVRTRQRLDPGIACEPRVEITDWTDSEGYQWFRIDDNGTGMTEAIIQNYFLKIGNSYYKSPEFEAEKLRQGIGADFTPISRFGIGILSCFLCGEQVEVSTRHYAGGPGLHLSLHGMNGYYSLMNSSLGHTAAPMPAAGGASADGYRCEPGTTIAVRVNLLRYGTEQSFAGILRKYVRFPTIPVLYNGAQVCPTRAELIQALGDGAETECEISQEAREQILSQLPGCTVQKWPVITVRSIPIHKYSFSPDLAGVLVTAYFDPKKTSGCFIKRGKSRFRITDLFALSSHGQDVSFDRTYQPHKPDVFKGKDFIAVALSLPISELWERLFPGELHRYLSPQYETVFNGIQIAQSNYSSIDGMLSTPGALSTTMLFQDTMDLDVSLSRDEVDSLPFETVMELYLTLWQIETAIPVSLSFGLINRHGQLGPYPFLRFQDYFESLDTARLEAFRTLFLVETMDGEMSITEISTALKEQSICVARHPWYLRNYSQILSDALLQFSFHILCNFSDTGLIADAPLEAPLPPEYMLFPPLFFCEDERGGGSILLRKNGTFFSPLNARHPFSKWLLNHARQLRDSFPAVFQRLKNCFSFYKTPEEIIETVNHILDNLKSLPNRPIPIPDDVYLKPSDFLFDPEEED